MKELLKPVYKTYGPEGEVKAKEELLESLRSLLDAGKGFAFSAVINMDGQPCVVHSAGGSLSRKMITGLVVETALFSKEITKESSIVEACQCPECQAGRERKNISSSVH